MTFWDPAGPLFIDVETLGAGYKGVFQLLFLGFVYTYILIAGCNLIGDGSELLEATPYAPLIGPTILPVLGAVPDAAIVFFSGFGSDAQTQLDTGMGALAGSTVMLLTIPWVLNLVGGAVDLIEDKDGGLRGDYPNSEDDPEGCGKGTLKDPQGWNIFTTGVEVDTEPIQASGWWMLVTCLPYVIIQIAAFRYDYYDDTAYADAENPYAWVGFAFCMVFFVAYLVYQLWITSGDSREDKTAAKAEALMQQGVPITAVLAHHVDDAGGANEETPAAPADKLEYGSEERASTSTLVGVNKVILKTIKPTFDKYCTVPEDGSEKYLDADELNIVFGKEFGINKRADQLKLMFAEFDTDGNGEISLQEFCIGVEKFLKGTLDKDDDAEDDEDEDPMSAAIKALSTGTLMVLLFSDPLVDVINELGDLTGIPVFYLAFLLAPMVTNGSELIASYRFAQKKTKNSITNSLQQLYGAAIMNNTMTLGVFLLLIAMQGLYWDYSAESIAIVFVQVALFCLCFTRVMTVASGFAVLALYPFCLLGVYLLENAAGLS